MKRRVLSRAGVLGFPVIVLSFLAFASTGSASNPANSNKPYSVVICGDGQTGCSDHSPAVVAPGGSASNPSKVGVTFTNDISRGNTNISLGSDNLNLPSDPAGFSVVDVLLAGSSTSLAQCPVSLSSFTDTCWRPLNNGATVGFRNLNLAPGQSASFTLALTTPPLSTSACTTDSPCLFPPDEAKQSNDFSGTGNDLTPDSTSSYSFVLDAVTSCAKKQGCFTNLADGGGKGDGAGSVNVIINTSGGKTAVTQIQALDFGTMPDSTNCSGVTSAHFTYWDMFNGADNGSDRSQTVSITTTPGFPGYDQEFCFVSELQFTQKTATSPSGPFGLAPATPTTFPDGGRGYQGLLPDCGSRPLPPLTVDCTKLPGVLQRLTNNDGTTTTVAAIPPGFDRSLAYN